LKELRESFIALKIINRNSLIHPPEKLAVAMSECNELISIFVKSIQTAQAKSKTV